MDCVSGRRRALRDEEGAAALEFALVSPLLFFLFFGIIYVLLVVAANVTLAHAASTAVRYASVPTDNIEPVYPSPAQVEAKLFSSTPFFTAEGCATSVIGDSRPNSPVTLGVSCPFANPLGNVLNGLRGLYPDGEGEPFADSFDISATVMGRRE